NRRSNATVGESRGASYGAETSPCKVRAPERIRSCVKTATGVATEMAATAETVKATSVKTTSTEATATVETAATETSTMEAATTAAATSSGLCRSAERHEGDADC